MTLQELRYLIALADTGHFGRAAQACRVSQPTLSAQLKKLEDFLGVTLFERTSKRLALTAEGAPILEKARRVVAEADGLIAQARQTSRPLTGPFRLGVIPSLAPYLLPWVLPVLQTRFPDLSLVLQEDLTAVLLEALKAHRLDGALLALPVDDAALQTQILFDEPFFLACPPQHPLARHSTVSVNDLAREPLLLLANGHCLRDQALAVCGHKSGAADVRAASLETIRQMVKAGLGITLLPALAIGQDPAVAIRPLQETAFRRIGLVWRKTHPQTDEFALLAAAIKAALPEAVRD